MNSDTNKPIAGRVAEHNSWPAERGYALEPDTVGMTELWDPRRRSSSPIRLGDILTVDRIKVPLAGSDSGQVVRELVDLLVDAGEIVNGDPVAEAIVSRERVRSTGVGGQLAIPHARTAQVKKLTMAFGTSAAPIDFDSIDGAGVRIVVMLLSPIEMTAQCIGVLNRIITMMNSAPVRSELLEARSAGELYETIRRHEAAAA